MSNVALLTSEDITALVEQTVVRVLAERREPPPDSRADFPMPSTNCALCARRRESGHWRCDVRSLWRDRLSDMRRKQREQCRARVTSSKSEEIYFVQSPVGGPIKIGRSTQLSTRLQALRAQHGSLVLLAKVPGGASAERSLHDKFANSRLYGEWFLPSTDLVSHIECLGQARA